MKIVNSLSTGRIDEAPSLSASSWVEPRGLLSAVHCELRPGYFVHVSLGSSGLQIYRGDARVGIPLSTLLEIAASVAPETFGVVPGTKPEIKVEAEKQASTKAPPR